MHNSRPLLILLLLIGPLFVGAQQDSNSTDATTVVTDTVMTPPAEESEYSSSDNSNPDTTWSIDKPIAADSTRITVRKFPANDLAAARDEDDFWYWNYRKKAKKHRPKATSHSSSAPFSIPSFLFWVLITIGILALLHFFLLSININVFGKRAVTLAGEEDAEAVEDIFGRNFEREIAAALASGDYRVAVRLRYLQLLRELSDRNIIQYRPGASNGAYVSQLRGTDYYSDFFRITRTFEYAWYGMLPVTQPAYERMLQDVAHLKSRFA